MILRNRTRLLNEALRDTCFVRRGSVFFRVWGDGVLQVLKFVKSHGDRVPELCIGIFSMYGRLEPQWFTSIGSISRGSVMSFVGLRFVDGWLLPERFTRTDDGQNLFEGFSVSIDPSKRLWDDAGEHWSCFFTPEQQIRILNERVLPWLDEMTTQRQAAEGMYRLFPTQNDALRFDAHLAAGDWDRAEETIEAILKQHEQAKESWKKTFSSEKFAEMAARQEERDAPMLAAYRMVMERNPDAIRSYLSENYRRNCEAASFCMRK